MRFRKGFVLAKVDEENGCEECWEALRKELKRLRVDEQEVTSFTGNLMLIPRHWRGKPCPHGAPKYAPSILL